MTNARSDDDDRGESKMMATSTEEKNMGTSDGDATKQLDLGAAPHEPASGEALLPPPGPLIEPPRGPTQDESTRQGKAQRKSKSARPRPPNPAEKPAGDAAESKQDVNSMDTVMDTYLRGTRLAASPPLPTGVLPPSLQVLFPDALSICAVMAAASAVVGQKVQLIQPDGAESILAMRLGIVGKHRRLPDALIPILDAAYELQTEEIQIWAKARANDQLTNAAEEVRRRLRRQMVANAGLLGWASALPAEVVTEQTPAVEGCPQLVARDAGPKDIGATLKAGRSGILVVDGRRMPHMAPYGMNYDAALAELLNLAAAGRPLEIPGEQKSGTRMRAVSISAIGVFSIIDTFGLSKVDEAAYVGAMFAVAGESTAPHQRQAGAERLLDAFRSLTRVLQRAQLVRLTLSKPAQAAVDRCAAAFADVAKAARRPLAHYYRQLGDITARVAAILHILDHSEAHADALSPVIDKGTVLRAVRLVETCLANAAESVLGPSSEPPDLRNARRLLSYAQNFCSEDYPIVARRDLVRHFQRSISVPAVDQAVRRLVSDGLFISPNPSVEGPNLSYRVNEVVFDPDNELPDLVSDPRRSRP